MIANLENKCVGIVGSCTLLCNSLIKHCRTPEEISDFTLLDVDTSEISMNHCGLIRSDFIEDEMIKTSSRNVFLIENV